MSLSPHISEPRVRYWSKDVTLVAGILFRFKLFRFDFSNLSSRFVPMSFVSSGLYTFGNAKDIDSDRLCLTRRKRTIGSGGMRIRNGLRPRSPLFGIINNVLNDWQTILGIAFWAAVMACLTYFVPLGRIVRGEK